MATLRVDFPKAQSLTAAKLVIEQLASKEKAKQSKPRQLRVESEPHETTPEQRQENRAEMKARWDQLSEHHQSEIKAVVKKHFKSRTTKPEVFLLLCMLEMERIRRIDSFSES